MLTLNDIAARLNVSRRTIARTISGTGYVSAEKRAAIEKFLRKTRFQKNVHAARLASRRTQCLGLALPASTQGDGTYLLDTLNGISAAARQAGFQIQYSAQSPYSVEECIGWYRSRMISGLVMVAPGASDRALVQAVEKEGVPLVLLHSRMPGSDCFDADNVAGGYAATRHLIEQGAKRIAFLHGHIDWINASDRYEGYLKALKEAKLPVNKEWTKQAFFDAGAAAFETEIWLAEKERPDAIFAANDLMAVGALNALKKARISVPGEIKVCGFDDSPICSLPIVSPSITSMAMPFEAMARAAADHLIKKITLNKKRGSGSVTLFEPRLIARESTNPSEAA